MWFKHYLPQSPRTTTMLCIGIVITSGYWFIFGPVASITFFAAMVTLISWESISALRVYPELAFFRDNADRRRELDDALKRKGGMSRSSGLMIVCLFLGFLIDQSSDVIRSIFPNVLSVRSYQFMIFITLLVVMNYAFRTWNSESIRRVLRARLVQLGHQICLECGYDLAGNESGTCPECGAAI